MKHHLGSKILANVSDALPSLEVVQLGTRLVWQADHSRPLLHWDGVPSPCPNVKAEAKGLIARLGTRLQKHGSSLINRLTAIDANRRLGCHTLLLCLYLTNDIS